MFSFTTGAYSSHAPSNPKCSPPCEGAYTYIQSTFKTLYGSDIIFHNISEVYADYKYLLSNKSLWHMQEHNIELNIKHRMLGSPMKHIRIGELIKIFYNS